MRDLDLESIRDLYLELMGDLNLHFLSVPAKEETVLKPSCLYFVDVNGCSMVLGFVVDDDVVAAVAVDGVGVGIVGIRGLPLETKNEDVTGHKGSTVCLE